jgi:hypothetical protein
VLNLVGRALAEPDFFLALIFGLRVGLQNGLRNSSLRLIDFDFFFLSPLLERLRGFFSLFNLRKIDVDVRIGVIAGSRCDRLRAKDICGTTSDAAEL